MAKKQTGGDGAAASNGNGEMLRAPAEVLYAEELEALIATDGHDKPPGWKMSARVGEGETRRSGDRDRRRPTVDEGCGVATRHTAKPCAVCPPAHNGMGRVTNMAAAASTNSASAAGSGIAINVTWPVV